jgi:hypothetical protein
MLDWLIIAIEPFHILFSGGTLQQAAATNGARWIAATLAFLIPSTLIGLGIGMTDWRETPLAQALGFRQKDEDRSWMDRAADLDGDRQPDM